jgi:diguanylate cyclase (GGDEF)-like protein/PAS domain S-box-containing protein
LKKIRFIHLEIDNISEKNRENKVLEKIVALSEEFLQSTVLELNYQKITDDILDISGAKYAAFNLFDEDGSKFRTVAFSAPGKVVKKVSSLLGFKLIGKKWDPDPVRAEKIKDHTITHFPTLSELSGEIIPKSLISLLEKMFNIGEVVLVKILRENIMIGDFTLMMPKNIIFNSDPYIEIYTRQLGLLITRSRGEAKLAENESRLRSIFAAVNDPLFLIDQETGSILDVNDAACKLYGYSHDEMLKLKIIDMSAAPEKTKQAIQKLNDAIAVGYHKNKEGNVFPVEISASSFGLSGRKFLTASMRDITERKKTEEEILYLSYHDQLTGLYNRRFFEEELKRLDTKRQLPISIIMADVDELKYVNDFYGHEKGDKLLIAASEIIKNSCRKEDIITRWGGDEFIIFLPKTAEKDAKDLIERIRKAYNIQKLDDIINISISLGFATKNNLTENIEDIIEQADKNMYIDKSRQKGNVYT